MLVVIEKTGANVVEDQQGTLHSYPVPPLQTPELARDGLPGGGGRRSPSDGLPGGGGIARVFQGKL